MGLIGFVFARRCCKQKLYWVCFAIFFVRRGVFGKRGAVVEAVARSWADWAGAGPLRDVGKCGVL
jgi:hypothetical protein